MKNEKMVKAELAEVVAHARADTGMTMVQLIRADLGSIMMKMTNGNPGNRELLTDEVRDFMAIVEKDIFMNIEKQALEVMEETNKAIPNFNMEGIMIEIPEDSIVKKEEDEDMDFDIMDLLADMMGGYNGRQNE